MKKQIIGITIAAIAVWLIPVPKLKNKLNNLGSLKVDKVEYQAIKLENSMDPMLNPEQGGVRPMPPPPSWIPPVEEGLNNTLPPSDLPNKPDYGNYTPMQHLPTSVPFMTPEVENEGEFEFIYTPPFPIR